ncbi:MAG: hypothetical protein KAT25_03750 [Sulfuriflexus sp.]|nr:hypothetical protein [Sulfuriflexus sp.]
MPGCKSLGEIVHQRNQNKVDNNDDVVMAKAFYPSPFGRKYNVNVVSNAISLVREEFKGGDLVELTSKDLLTDTSKDDIATLYIKTAKARGNTIKLYKPAINSKIIRTFRRSVSRRTKVTKTDLSHALIEYDANNRIISALVRINQYDQPIVSWGSIFTSQLFLGSAARIIENKISNRLLDDNYLATM